MSKITQTWEQDGFLLRRSRKEDAEEYYSQNFTHLDSEAVRLTGSKEVFTHDEVVSFFLQCVDADDRYDFLIIAPDGRIIGESIINEIDWKVRCANFRIVIFHADERGKGIGSWAIKATQDFAFEKLKLHRLELDVFSFNPFAEKAYLSAGFKREGVLRDALWTGKEYADDILMAILEEEWKQQKDSL